MTMLRHILAAVTNALSPAHARTQNSKVSDMNVRTDLKAGGFATSPLGIRGGCPTP